MKTIFDRFHVWLAKYASHLSGGFHPGATQEQIVEAEQVLGVRLPEEVRAAYRIHDGGAIDFLYGVEWMSLDGVVRDWRVLKDLVDKGIFDPYASRPTGPIRSEWWHPLWIPLTANGCGDSYCLDLAPLPGGKAGQIIFWWHDDSRRDVISGSFTEFLADFARELDLGNYGCHPDYGVVSIDDLMPGEEFTQPQGES